MSITNPIGLHWKSIGDQQDVHNKLNRLRKGIHRKAMGYQQAPTKNPWGIHIGLYEINIRFIEHTQDSMGESIGNPRDIHNKVNRLQ